MVLNERGRVDIDHVAELLYRDPITVISDLSDTIFRSPADNSWYTLDAYLSSAVQTKLVAAQGASKLDSAGERDVRALQDVQPAGLQPSDITVRLGVPWFPAADFITFVHETTNTDIRIHYVPELGSWIVESRQLGYSAAGTSEWGTSRHHAGELLVDALNSALCRSSTPSRRLAVASGAY